MTLNALLFGSELNTHATFVANNLDKIKSLYLFSFFFFDNAVNGLSFHFRVYKCCVWPTSTQWPQLSAIWAGRDYCSQRSYHGTTRALNGSRKPKPVAINCRLSIILATNIHLAAGQSGFQLAKSPAYLLMFYAPFHTPNALIAILGTFPGHLHNTNSAYNCSKNRFKIAHAHVIERGVKIPERWVKKSNYKTVARWPAL